MLLMMPISYALLDITVRKIRTKIVNSEDSQDDSINDV